MAKTPSKGKKIAATAGIILAGLAAGPAAAIGMMMHLGSTGELESEWAVGYLFTHIMPSFVIGTIVGCCVAAYFVRVIWR